MGELRYGCWRRVRRFRFPRRTILLSPMRLDKAWLEEMIIEAPPSEEKSAGEPIYTVREVDFSLQARSDHRAFRLRLSVEIAADARNPAPGLRRIRIVVGG